jgi:hypothetical protein
LLSTTLYYGWNTVILHKCGLFSSKRLIDNPQKRWINITRLKNLKTMQVIGLPCCYYMTALNAATEAIHNNDKIEKFN